VFPSLKARQLLGLLSRKPFEYRIKRQVGSHRLLVSPNGYPELRFSFHDKATIPPGAVRKILMKDVDLSELEATRILRGMR
jgi:predicted RNA binding protein YcfA (HicA-like mRNA interferase family)